MLKRYLGLLKKDIVTGLRNYYFLIVIAVALLFVFIINFVIPEDISIKPSVYYYVEYEGMMRKQFEKVIGQSKEEHKNIYEVNSRDEVIQNVKDNTNSLGMIVKNTEGKPTIEFILQGYENQKLRNALILSMKDEINKIVNQDIEIDIVKLKEGLNITKIPTNKNVLPIFLLMEPTSLGLILIASLIFMEKDEGTIRAYIVTPGRLPEYLASKITLMIILGLISTFISTVLVVGFNVDFLSLMVLVVLGGIFFSAVGLILASFFQNISQSIIWLIIISILISLPMVSYFVPSFAPLYIRILPTYPLMFAIREAVFPTGNTDIIFSNIIYFLILSLGSYLLSILAYKLHLVRD